MHIKVVLALLLCLLALPSKAQTSTDLQLAQYYYNNAELDKALGYFEKVYAQDQSKAIFLQYYECLVAQNDFKTAEKVWRKQTTINKQDFQIRLLGATLYEDQNEPNKAQKIYQELFDELQPNNPGQAIGLYQAFVAKAMFDQAKKALEMGQKLSPNYPFNFQMADYYSLVGNKKAMLMAYMDYLGQQPGTLDPIAQAIGSRLDLSASNGQDFNLCREVLLERIQQAGAPMVFNQLLIWLFVQVRDFSGGVTQAIALNKRMRGDGREVLELGHICVENAVFDQANRCFQYVIELGQDQPHFYDAQRALLNARFIQVTQYRSFNDTEIAQCIADFESALNRLGRNRVTFQLILQLAEIRAFYAKQSAMALDELQALMRISGLTDLQIAQVKMLVADIEVLEGDIWEASLIYMQVDSDFKFETIGSEAKFKNAKIFYYDGEFEFAQAQLDILKEGTSRFIANDAIQLSVFITDNYGLDSNYQVMSWFATADRMIAQHKYDSAFVLFDSIQAAFPYHSLADDILFRKGQINEQQGKWEQAINYYEDLLKLHATDLLADDALFRLAEINELILKDIDRAEALYKRILLEYKSSLFGAEARKRIRLLRGDTLSQEEDI